MPQGPTRARPLLARNPSDLADAPRARLAEQVRERTWTSAEVAKFLRVTATSRYTALWRLLATTGLRRGEAHVNPSMDTDEPSTVAALIRDSG